MRYVPAEQAQGIGGQLADIKIIFQRADPFGAVIRVTFDGSAPGAAGREGAGKAVPANRPGPDALGDDDDWPPPEPRDDFGGI
tara:strand:- start:294 stop:542 length:249 start_codon:yes stop_codon:yes gene_type:complete